jgi:hypothetical protein
MDQFGYERQGILVGDCPFVESSIVLYQMELPIFLPDEEEATCIW